MFIHRTLSLALAAALLTFAAAEAQAHGRGFYRGSGHWRPGLVLGGIGIGIGLSSYYGGYYGGYGGGYGGYYGAPLYPAYRAVPPVVVYESAAQPVPLVAAEKPAPEPVIYPRNGQSAAQTEADQQACNRWATTQPSAMADASVFQRAAAACMDGRGYTVR